MTRVLVVSEGEIPPADLVLKPNGNVLTGVQQFRAEFGSPTSLEIDTLNVVATIFAADIAIKRGEREEITRKIDITIPVTNLAAFNGIRSELIYALSRLSFDGWNLRFVQQQGDPERARVWEPTKTDTVLLFSGGLDSLAGALMLAEQNRRVALVSHVTMNRAVSGAQESLFGYLIAQFPGLFERLTFRVSGRRTPGLAFPSDQDREETQRTRSLLFLALASLVARRRGVHEIVMIAENGQMAIHLPLTVARVGAFSTHTAHPEVINTIGRVFSTLLQHDIQVTNPFLYNTKAEVIASAMQNHRATLVDAISCWKASRVGGELNHCGFCIPCLIRRIAVETHGPAVPEYSRDLLAEDVSALPPDDDGKRNLVDLGEFVRHFANQNSDAVLHDLFPELGNGHFDAAQAIQMYRRFAAEASAVFARYPRVAALLA